MAPRVSVILPTRNRLDTLRTALASVAAQGRDDVEVVVVNDGGVPVEPVLEDAAVDVHLLTLPVGTGTSAARNHALTHAEGEYVALLDDDDVYLPGHLDAAVAALTDAEVAHASVGVSDHWIAPNESPDPRHVFDLPFHDRFLSVLNFLPTTGLVFRAERREHLWFDPELKVAEDWDLVLRLARRHGYRFRHVDRVGVVYHRIPAHSRSADPVGDGRRALGLFHDGYLRMCARWPVRGDSRESAYRDLVLRVYDLAFARYDDGRTLGTFWYERMVRTLHDGFVAGVPSDRLVPELSGLLEDL